MKHANLVKLIQLELGQEADFVMWTNPTAFAYVGVKQAQIGTRIILDPGSGEQFGLCEGSSDLVFIRRRLITPEMVGSHIGQFGVIEAKVGEDTLKPKQRDFQNTVIEMGGIAGVAYTPQAARQIVFGA